MLHRPYPRFFSARLLRRVLIGLLALLVLAFVAIEIILSTDLPRNLVINAVERQLGLRITAKSLSTGFFGHTTLEDVTATLPLADRAFLDIPELKLETNWLPGMILGSLTIHQISIDHPRLEVLQDPNGTWNLQEVAELILRTGGGGTGPNANPQSSQPNDIPLLPSLDVSDADLIITDNQHRTATIDHLQVTGRSDGALVWQYTATIPGKLDLNGKLAPGGAWAHRLDIQIQNAREWLTPWIASWPASAQLQARWDGKLESSNLSGRLEILHANYHALSISGPFEVTSGDSSAAIHPVGVLISAAPAYSLGTRIAGGNITFGSSGIDAQNLGLEFAQGRAQLDAKYAFADGSASLHAVWRDLAITSSILHSGDFQLEYSSPLGQPRFQATLENHGTTRSGKWDAQISLNGTGNSLTTVSSSLYAEKLSFESSSGRSFNVTGLSADIDSYPKGLLLHDLRAGHQHPLEGRGGLSVADRTAWLSLDGRGWPILGENPTSLDFDLNLWSNATRVHLDQIYFNTGMFTAFADGDYTTGAPQPLSLRAYLTENPTPPTLEARPFHGLLQSTIDLSGTLCPLNLVLNGTAQGNDVSIGPRPIGDVNLNLAGYFRDDLVYVSSQNVQLLGGTWNVSGYWPARNSLFHIDNLSVDHLSLPLAADTDKIAGTLDGRCSIDVHDFTLNGLDVDGSFNLRNLVIGNPQSALAKYLTFDEVRVPSAQLRYGTIDLRPIALTRTVGKDTGNATLNLYTTLQNLKNLYLGINASQWPIQPEGSTGSCLLSARGNVDLDLAAVTAIGQLNLKVDTSLASEPLGQLSALLKLESRSAELQNVQIKTLGGEATGSAAYDLDKPFTSNLNLNWKNLDLSALKPISAKLATLSGKSDGLLQIAPATTPRPLGPMAMMLQLHSRSVRYRNFNIGDIQLHGFWGPDRFVLDDTPDQPCQVAIANGTISFWGRVARHEDGVYQSLAQFNLHNIQLDTILPAGAKTAKAPGLLNGQVTVIGHPGDFDLLTGQGDLTLTHSDLAGTGPISLVYDLMNLTHDPKKPVGTGRLEFTIQHRSATITALHYSDKGREIRLSGEIADLTALPDSPISLIVVGSARPLSSLNIPGLTDIGDALQTIQHDAFTVRVTGTLAQPREKAIPFTDIGQEMKNLLFGDVQAATE
jgi:hypothetical protein